jgi:hypothetical protein
MPHGNPNAHRQFSEFYTSQHYQADLLKFKEDLVNAIKSKLRVDMGTTHLYQEPYPAEFDFVPFPAGWRILEFTKFNGDDSRTTWEHVSKYVLQLREAGFNDALRVRLFFLSLTGTAFTWFSSLAPNSIRNWAQLEHKFHDHFFSGETEAKLLDLTSIKQGCDESASDYFKRFKEIKNWCLVRRFLKRIWRIWRLMAYVLI